MKTFSFNILFVLLCCSINAQQSLDEVLKGLDNQTTFYGDIAHTIWEFAEMGYQEEKSSALLQKTLNDEGFSITTGVAAIPTAFIAEYGSGSPIIGILGEYDALPGLSQLAVAEKKIGWRKSRSCLWSSFIRSRFGCSSNKRKKLVKRK